MGRYGGRGESFSSRSKSSSESQPQQSGLISDFFQILKRLPPARCIHILSSTSIDSRYVREGVTTDLFTSALPVIHKIRNIELAPNHPPFFHTLRTSRTLSAITARPSQIRPTTVSSTRALQLRPRPCMLLKPRHIKPHSSHTSQADQHRTSHSSARSRIVSRRSSFLSKLSPPQPPPENFLLAV